MGSDRALASLVVLSSSRSPGELAAAVGLPADRAWVRGERPGAEGHSGAIPPFNGIEYVSRVPRHDPIEEHVDDLFLKLHDVVDNVARIGAEIVEEEGRATS